MDAFQQVLTAAAVTTATLRVPVMEKVTAPVYLMEPKRFAGMDACRQLLTAALMESTVMLGTFALPLWGSVVIMYVVLFLTYPLAYEEYLLMKMNSGRGSGYVCYSSRLYHSSFICDKK